MPTGTPARPRFSPSVWVARSWAGARAERDRDGQRADAEQPPLGRRRGLGDLPDPALGQAELGGDGRVAEALLVLQPADRLPAQPGQLDDPLLVDDEQLGGPATLTAGIAIPSHGFEPVVGLRHD